MKNFDYNIPTRVHFGKGQISKLRGEVKNFGHNVLLVYGGNSIKRNGIYDQVMEQLNDSDINVFELSGIAPNPRIDSARDGVKLCKECKIDVILAVGGGSVIDCSKLIAAGAFYDGDPWDLVLKSSLIKEALPIISVLTLSATGSEMDGFAVISNMETNDKLGMGGEILKPRVSILDPEYTYTVPANQTAAGTADIMSHIIETYFHDVEGAYLQDRFAESLLKTCIEFGPIAVKEPKNYDARANLMWASSHAINGMISYGTDVGWSVHPMEHELSAYYDITHGVGLAILTPRWMKHILSDETVGKFVDYGVNVWGIDSSLDKFEIANRAIEKTYDFFASIGIPMNLREVGIDEENLEVMAEFASKRGAKYGYVSLSKEDVLEIYKMSL